MQKELGNQISCQNQKQAKSKTETKTSMSTEKLGGGRQTGAPAEKLHQNPIIRGELGEKLL